MVLFGETCQLYIYNDETHLHTFHNGWWARCRGEKIVDRAPNFNNFEFSASATSYLICFVSGAFRLYDVDNDGFITRDEMYNIVDAIYQMVVSKNIKILQYLSRHLGNPLYIKRCREMIFLDPPIDYRSYEKVVGGAKEPSHWLIVLCLHRYYFSISEFQSWITSACSN